MTTYKYTISGVDENGRDVSVVVESESWAEIANAFGLPTELKRLGVKPKPKFSGGNFNKKPSVQHLPDAPKNDKGEPFDPMLSKQGTLFWSKGKWNTETNKFDYERVPQGTPPPTAEQYKKFLEMNPQVASKVQGK